uniref:Neprosin PEP catalytic domain-containing protein n=1 Tax=Oryza barthii TaxID=65489 RepID=A0A0D3H3C9_9ORYZ
MAKRRRRWRRQRCCSSDPPLAVAAAALLLLLLVVVTAAPVVDAAAAGRHVVQRHLDRINKPGVRSIHSADGDIIDCVPRHKQRALDHPLLANHTVQTQPSQMPASASLLDRRQQLSRRAWQTWHHSGHCPRGTVAVRRTAAADVQRARSLALFGRKKQMRSPLPAPDVVTGNGHELTMHAIGNLRQHAIAYTAAEVYGARATISVWAPEIDEANGFSLSQLWILSGSFNGSDLNSIEAGWQVSPELYGDNRPRLFTYWTDPKLGNWWLSYGDGAGGLVGYWPAELFTHLSDHATMVEWGGEVVNTHPPGSAHTATQMGSGHFAAEGFGRAAYFRNLETVDADNSLAAVPLDAIQTMAEDAGCYDIRKAYDDDDGRGGWGAHFYYGGPGHNTASCP